MPIRTLLSALSLLLLLETGCRVQETPEISVPSQTPGRAKNIILLIGDGMGLAQISAALYSNNNKLALEQFTTIGLHKPNSANDLITDSAAGATAFACGQKTYNGAIGINADSVPCYTILEEAEARGYATGLIATSTIVHATPASFIAHQPIRIFYEEIAADFLKTDIDLFIGGGKRYFDRREKDSRNLYAELQKKGYLVSDYSIEELSEVSLNGRRNFAFFTADKHPVPAEAGRDYLPYAVKMACSFLSKRSEQGFFLMAEGSQIDWGGHSNDGRLTIGETLDFDKAVAAALDFARKDGQTLVVVTADHESGGMALNPGSEMNAIQAKFTTNGHTGTMVPVFAYGPSSKLFGGIYDNTEIYFKMKQALGFLTETTSASP